MKKTKERHDTGSGLNLHTFLKTCWLWHEHVTQMAEDSPLPDVIRAMSGLDMTEGWMEGEKQDCSCPPG